MKCKIAQLTSVTAGRILPSTAAVQKPDTTCVSKSDKSN